MPQNIFFRLLLFVCCGSAISAPEIREQTLQDPTVLRKAFAEDRRIEESSGISAQLAILAQIGDWERAGAFEDEAKRYQYLQILYDALKKCPAHLQGPHREAVVLLAAHILANDVDWETLEISGGGTFEAFAVCMKGIDGIQKRDFIEQLANVTRAPGPLLDAVFIEYFWRHDPKANTYRLAFLNRELNGDPTVTFQTLFRNYFELGEKTGDSEPRDLSQQNDSVRGALWNVAQAYFRLTDHYRAAFDGDRFLVALRRLVDPSVGEIEREAIIDYLSVVRIWFYKNQEPEEALVEHFRSLEFGVYQISILFRVLDRWSTTKSIELIFKKLKRTSDREEVVAISLGLCRLLRRHQWYLTPDQGSVLFEKLTWLAQLDLEEKERAVLEREILILSRSEKVDIAFGKLLDPAFSKQYQEKMARAIRSGGLHRAAGFAGLRLFGLKPCVLELINPSASSQDE